MLSICDFDDISSCIV